MKISLCMIVKNEEKYIKTCLENAMKLVDEAIIVDTGSTDKTKEIIEGFRGNIKVIDYKWEDDFSKARNISIEAATGDWILMLDADEKLLCDVDKVRSTLENSELEAYRIPLYNILDVDNIVYSSVYLKFFRNNKGYRYSGSIHEQLNIPNNDLDKNSMSDSICKIIHYGYLLSNLKDRKKSARNLRILKSQLKNNPGEPFITYNIGVCYEIDADYKNALKYFFKANDILKKKCVNKMTLYEIDMAKRICECLINLKKYDDCIMLATNLLNDEGYKGYVDLQYLKGWCHFSKKKYKEAIIDFEKCIEMGDTKKFISIMGMGSFKPKFMIARCYVELKDEVKAINYFMESIFDPNNFVYEGVDLFRLYLHQRGRVEILNELNKLLEKLSKK